MQSRFIKDITVYVKMLILLLLICTLFIAKSIFLLAFITILSLIILILLGGSVNEYVDFIKKIFIWLLFIVITYIIIYKGINGLLIFMYKFVLSVVLIHGLISNLNFDELHSGFYGILKPLNRFNIDVESKSFNIALSIVFLKALLYSSDSVGKLQCMRNKRNYGIKYFLFPRLLWATNYSENLKNNLKLKFYSLKCEKLNFRSVLLLILFIALFISAIFKEVIL